VTTIRTPRLILRPVRPEDAPEFEAFYGDPEVMEIRKYGVLDKEGARTQIETMVEHWRAYGFGMWVVEEQTCHGFCGECGLRWVEDGSEVELSYGLYPQYRGRGMATEAAQAALGFGTDVLGLERIVAFSRGDNRISHRVLEKLGMTLEWRRQTGAYGLVRYLFVADSHTPGAAS
jgi:ribosomal-protein-alanine N-acetyltransferase